MYAKIDNNKIIDWPISSLVPLFPNMSLPPNITDSNIPEGYVIVHSSVPPIPGTKQKVVPGIPKFNGIKWVQGWDIVSQTEEDITNHANNLKAERAQAYIREADPLFFKWQRGEVSQQEWLDKVSEIKQRFPNIELPSKI